MLTLDRERTALSLFAEAIEREHLDVRARLTWIEEACRHDPELIRRVIELIEADNEVTALAEEVSATLELPPETVGVYRLEALIGAGGMGAVYRARRDDGLFDQTVAIKFIRARQGRVDLGPLIDAERRTLARMDHPSIARILDGGITPGGLSYLVMEYVAGEPLDDHAEAAGLDAAARVVLVRQVASALAHAHQSRIVHCDVKPSNILVTADGRAKLIDFGIARLHEVAAAEGLDGATRAYASPERARKQPATLSDDVYSLAVTLYQLLAGRLPWEDGRLDLDAPPRPLMLEGVRNGEDLAAILLRALSIDPQQRYRSIETFDADLAAWQQRQPVSAMPRRFPYLARRFAQRRPLLLGAVAGGVAATFVALGVITHLYLAADEARRAADQRFTELRSLAGFMIFDLNTQLEQVPGTTPARLAMSSRAQDYLDALGASAGGNGTLQAEVATGLIRLAEVQGVASRPNLGLAEQAIVNLDRAVATLDPLIRNAPAEASLRIARGRALYFLAVTRGAFEQAPETQLTLARSAEEDVTAALAHLEGAPAGEANSMLLGIKLTEADALQTQGDTASALAIREGEEARLMALPEAMQTGMDIDYDLGRVAAYLGDSYYYQDRFEDSKAAYERAAARFEASAEKAPNNRRMLNGLHYAWYALSGVRGELGDAPGGLAAAETSMEVANRLLAWDPSDRLAQQMAETSRGQIAIMLARNGRGEEAIARVDEQLARYRVYAASHPQDGDAQRRLAVPLRSRADMIADVRGKAAGCAAYGEARAAWASVEAAWGLSDFDRINDVAAIDQAIAELGCK